jgi:uncharacterized membrane protein
MWESRRLTTVWFSVAGTALLAFTSFAGREAGFILNILLIFESEMKLETA